jgi:hypothetical protein
MKKSHIKFNLIDNKKFHDQLENRSESVLHYKTMRGMMHIIQKYTDPSGWMFRDLPTKDDGKCYYPLFLREPFSLKDIDFCKFIDPKHLRLMQEKKIIPLVVMVTELWVLFKSEPKGIFKNSPYYNVINRLEQNGINEEDVVWLTCDKYQSQDQRIKAKFIHFDYFLEQQKTLPNEFLKLDSIEKKYISMAQGVHRHHRYGMTYQLYHHDLLSSGLVSCPLYENFSYISVNQMTNDYMKKFRHFNENYFEEWKKQLPYEIDQKQNLHQYRKDEGHLFKHIFLSLVNETHQPDDRVFITEKTYRCINYCRPFVINGDKGSLRYLKEMGFKTFGEFWDESYDDEQHDHLRIEKIVGIVKKVCQMSNEQLMAQYNQMLPILEHNYNVLKNYEQFEKLN